MNESGCPTFRSWHGVCPKLLMMPSRAFRSVSLAIASKSTAPAGQQAGAQERSETQVRNAEKITFSHPHKCNSRTHWELLQLLLLSVCNQRSDRSTRGGDWRRTRIPGGWHRPCVTSCSGETVEPAGCRLTRAFICFLMKSSLDVAHRGSRTSATWSCDICRRPRSKPKENDKAARHQPLLNIKNNKCLRGSLREVLLHRSCSPGILGNRRTLGWALWRQLDSPCVPARLLQQSETGGLHSRTCGVQNEF